jgi:hypothetical protein
MFQDFQSIVASLSGMIDPRSNEKKEFTEKYINAWNLGAEELLQFILDNKVY